MPVEEVLEKPENIKSSLRIPGTMEVLALFQGMVFVKWNFVTPQWMKSRFMSNGYPDVCGHIELPLSCNPDLTCAECHGTYAADQE